MSEAPKVYNWAIELHLERSPSFVGFVVTQSTAEKVFQLIKESRVHEVLYIEMEHSSGTVVMNPDVIMIANIRELPDQGAQQGFGQQALQNQRERPKPRIVE